MEKVRSERQEERRRQRIAERKQKYIEEKKEAARKAEEERIQRGICFTLFLFDSVYLLIVTLEYRILLPPPPRLLILDIFSNHLFITFPKF